MAGFSGKIKNLSFFRRYPKALNILTLLVVFSFLPLLVFALQQSQDTRQRAEGPSITPNPLAGSCNDLEHHIERSLLRNADFNNEYANGIPTEWKSFKEGDVDFSEETGNEKWGRAGLKITGKGAFKAGVYQTIESLTPGNWYHAFYATAQQMWGPNGKDDGLPTKREVGVDLLGGTNPNSANIIWGRSSGCENRNGCLYGTWHTLGLQNNPLVSFTANTNKVTVFLRVSGEPSVANSETWVDEIYLTPACQNDFVGGQATPPTPTTIQSVITPAPTSVIHIRNGDLNSYPKPKYDTGIGMHWAADGGNDTSNAKNSVCTLKDMGVSWIKLLAVGPSALDLAKIMKQNYIEPIIRLYRYQPLPSTMPQPDIDAVGEYVKNDIYYFESTNEPNIRTEWENEALPDCNSAVNQTMQTWTKDALHIQQKGGIPLFPALSPGGVCDDVNFLRDSFNWLKTNTCELANGSNGSCLELFNADKSNGKPAVMSIHNYNFNHDNGKNGDGSVSFYTEDSNAFLKFSTYNQIINENLGRNIPILATEGGMHVGDNPDPRFPTTDNSWHRDVSIAMSEYQMNNQAPYFFNTAFWLSMPNPDGNWSANAWFNRDLSPKISETVNALKNLNKKTRNGETYPSSCSFVTPSPTQKPNVSPSPTLNPRISPSPTSTTPAPRRPSPTPRPKKIIRNYVAFPCPTIPSLGLQLGCIIFATPTPR
ncbi:hypothetical protein C4559_06125 [Candidatus Microgenomates bacterium]|nr:MAG: hypothetical protein C4559_06125 [Candidatus Microgenomates bacterium]